MIDDGGGVVVVVVSPLNDFSLAWVVLSCCAVQSQPLLFDAFAWYMTGSRHDVR